MKTYVSLQFSNNSYKSLIHTKSLDYYLLLREYCFYQKLYLKVKFSLYDLLLIRKKILCQEIKQSLMKFSIDFCLISRDKDHFRNIKKKMKRKINLHTKGTLKGKVPLFLRNINVKPNLEKNKFPIRYSQPISHTST